MVVATAMRDPAKIAPSSELDLPSRTLCLVNGELHSMVGRSRWSGADDDTPFSASRDSKVSVFVPSSGATAPSDGAACLLLDITAWAFSGVNKWGRRRK